MRNLLVAAACCLVSMGASAAPFGYSINLSDDTLYRIDLATGAATAVGAGVGQGFQIEALAFDPTTGQLYGLDDDSDLLVTVDINTGIATPVGPLGFNVDEGGIAISSSGAIIASDEDGDTYSVNKSTGAGTLIGDSAIETDNLTFAGGLLYGVDRFSAELFTISTLDATPTLVGPLGVSTSSQHGLSFDPVSGFLYLGDSFGSAGNIYRVNRTTGAATLVASAPFGLASLAIQPNQTIAAVPVLGVWGPLPLALLVVLLGIFRKQAQRASREAG